jgi:hypothetical protein
VSRHTLFTALFTCLHNPKDRGEQQQQVKAWINFTEDTLYFFVYFFVYTCLHKIFFSFWIILMNNVIILAFCRSKRRLDGLVSHFDVFVFGDIFLRFFFVFWAVKRNFVLFRAALCEILKKTILVLTRFRFLCCLLLLSIYRFWREAKIFSNKWFCVMFYVKSGFHILKSLDYFLFISLY